MADEPLNEGAGVGGGGGESAEAEGGGGRGEEAGDGIPDSDGPVSSRAAPSCTTPESDHSRPGERLPLSASTGS